MWKTEGIMEKYGLYFEPLWLCCFKTNSSKDSKAKVQTGVLQNPGARSEMQTE